MLNIDMITFSNDIEFSIAGCQATHLSSWSNKADLYSIMKLDSINAVVSACSTVQS